MTLSPAMQAATDEMLDAIEQVRTKTVSRIDELEQRVDSIETRAGRPLLGGFDPLKSGGGLTAEYKALGHLIKLGDDGPLREIKSTLMETQVDPAGGYLPVPEISAQMVARLWDTSPIRRLARIQPMATGTSWVEPVDRGEAGAEWVGENQARPPLDTPVLSANETPLNEIAATQSVSQKLLDLSFVDIGAWLTAKIADKFARSEATAFVTGDGVNKPMGILSYPIVSTADASRPNGKLQYVAGGQASTVDADSLRSIYWGLRAPYRSNATWLMSSATASAIDKLKASGSGDYLWRPAVSSTEPPTLLGRPVEFSEDMPAIGAGNYPILFGDFKRGYLVVERPGLKLLRDPYTSKPSVVFYAYRRVGGGLADCDAIKVLKVATS